MVIETASSVEGNVPSDKKEKIQNLNQVVKSFEKEKIRPLWDRTSKSSFGIQAVEGTKFGPENIVAIGIGKKSTGGRPTGDLCIKVFTEVKAHPDWVSEESMIPDIWEGSKVDVEAIGHIEAFGLSLGFAAPQGFLNPRQRFRNPIPCGVSIGHTSVTAGTLGCLCTSSEANEPVLVLSNNHVLAASNAGKEGDPIIQPGSADNGRSSNDIVARLHDFVPLVFDGADNFTDAALAKPEPDVKFSPGIQGIGSVRGVVDDVEDGTLVKKMGRTTQLTEGIISEPRITAARVGMREAGTAVFADIIGIEGRVGPFSTGGDSGSLILDQRNRAVGLLFAGSDRRTLAIPIATALSKFSETDKGIQDLRIITNMV
jgi:hypothetical protein